MELTAYFHRIYSIAPWNPLNFHGINGKNLWHFMNFHNFLLLVYLPSTAMEALKTPSEYSVDFNRGFQGFSIANLEKGRAALQYTMEYGKQLKEKNSQNKDLTNSKIK